MPDQRNTILPAVVLAGAALVLAACAQDRGSYMKSGSNVSNVELDQTKEGCQDASSSFGFAFGNPNVGPDRPRLPGTLGTRNTVTRQEADLYRLCMNDRGYGRVDAEKAAGSETE